MLLQSSEYIQYGCMHTNICTSLEKVWSGVANANQISYFYCKNIGKKGKRWRKKKEGRVMGRRGEENRSKGDRRKKGRIK